MSQQSVVDQNQGDIWENEMENQNSSNLHLLSLDEVRNLVFESNKRVQQIFIAEFPQEIERAVRGIAAAFEKLERFRRKRVRTQLFAVVELFFHSALHSVLCSVHHLVSGYPIAAGNMMRHFIESVAMAILCMEPSLGVFDEFSRAPSRYPVQKAPTKLKRRDFHNKLKTIFGFDSSAWDQVMKLNRLYDKLSHASALALGHQQMLNREDIMIFGGEYDSAKREQYKADLIRNASAAEVLATLIETFTTITTEKKPT